jgi:serine/threonine protein kinase
MADSNHPDLRRIFDAAMEMDSALRPAFLARECGANAELRARVAALVAAAADEQFLSRPITAPQPEGPGSRIGPYELERQLGEGGFGAVFLATQRQPVARTVALKILKLGMDTTQVVARFDQERQALARMDHPHIARVIDAGATALGRPYFVMEFVDGEPISEFCDRHQLTIANRLELFAQVCDAVQHAHGRGIIHRDLKPTNVLVAVVEGKPHAKVIDFGIAKAIAHKLTDKTLFTEAQQVVGTLRYMSPEQASGLPDLDIRTDVYSLGVLLYELLTGSTPLHGTSVQQAWHGELQRLILEHEPPKPSTRLTELHQRLPELAARRRTAPHRLSAEVRGELDWIVMKAIEKERDRRYSTANDFAADLRRLLAGDPVIAAPPSATYRLRKFVRRHRGAVAAGIALLLSLLGGAAAFAWQAEVARGERDRAVLASEQARQIQQLMVDALDSADPSEGGTQGALVVDAMARAGAMLDEGRVAQFPSVELELRITIAAIVANNGAAATALPHAERAVALARALHPADAEPTVNALSALANAQRELGRADLAEPLRREALAMVRRLHPGDHQMVVQLMQQHAMVLEEIGQPAAAAPLLADSLAMARRLFPGDHWFVASLLNAIGREHWLVDRNELAEPLLVEAVAMARRLQAGDHPKTARFLANLATVISVQRGAEALVMLDEALAMTQRIYAGDHPDVVGRRTQLGNLQLDLGRLADARTQYESALQMSRRLWAGDHPRTALLLSQLGTVRSRLGELAEAEALYEDHLAMQRNLHPGDHQDVAQALALVAAVRQQRGNLEGVEAQLQEALAMNRRVFLGDHAQVLSRLHDLGYYYWAVRRPVDAETVFAEQVAMSRRLHPGDHAAIVNALDDHGSALLALANFELAEKVLTETLAMGRRLDAEDVVLEVRMLVKLLQVHVGRQNDEAVQGTLAAIGLASRRGTASHASALLRALRGNGLLHLQEGRLALAEFLLREGVELNRRCWPEGHRDTAQALEELGVSLARQEKHPAAAAAFSEALTIVRGAVPVDGQHEQRLQQRLAKSLGK